MARMISTRGGSRIAFEFHRGSAIDATNPGDNRIVVATKNVARFTVWLHPKMVDVTRPVVIEVNGVALFKDRVRPSLITALESFERRGDWGLLYPIKVQLRVPGSGP